MKFSFADKFVKTRSFIELCNVAQNYGFDGIEISNVEEEISNHTDSIFRPSFTGDSKRKLVNRHISIPVISYPERISENTNCANIVKYIEYAALASISGVVIKFDTLPLEDKLKEILSPAIVVAESNGISILIETCGPLVKTEKILEVINLFGTAVLKVCWNIRETFFTAGESADNTIQTLGAYIGHVRLGDKKDGENVLIGDGELPVKDFTNALRSLNYDGYVSVMDSGKISSADIILTHFKSYLTTNTVESSAKPVYYNRSKTGTHPWKKFDVLDLTFSDVLDQMVESYPDQYAFKYTTLDYTRTYSEFRDDVDKVAAALISMGVEPGHHVAVWATNVPQWFITFWATVKIGAVLVTVNTAYKIHEAEYLS